MAYFDTLWLTTLNHIKTHRNLTNVTTDDNILKDLLREASAELISALKRIPMPHVDTLPIDAKGDHISLWTLDVKDLLAVTTFTNGDGVAITSGQYVLESAGHYPKWRIRLKSSSGVVFTYSTDWEQAISLVGLFGYVPHWGQNAITDSGQDGTLAAATTTTLNVSDGTAFEIGQYIRLEDEYLHITNISGNALTVARAQLGSTGAAHSGVDIEVFNQLWDIRKACREIVVYKYLAKDRIGGTVRVFNEGGSVIVDELDPVVQTTIDRHQHGKAWIGVA